MTRPRIDGLLVSRLIETQFPAWAALPLHLVEPGGSDQTTRQITETLIG